MAEGKHILPESERRREEKHAYYLANREMMLEKRRKYKKDNKEKRRIASAIYWKKYWAKVKNDRPPKLDVVFKTSPAKRKGAMIRHYRNKNNPEYKIVKTCRSRLSAALRRGGARKSVKSFELIGCSKDILLHHLESLWGPGMNWGNHGLFGWHVDHKIPCSYFDLTDPAQQRECFHYTNLQPLWAKDNLSKRNKLI